MKRRGFREKPGIFSKETAGRYILSTEVQPTNLYVKTLSFTFTTVRKPKTRKIQLVLGHLKRHLKLLGWLCGYLAIELFWLPLPASNFVSGLSPTRIPAVVFFPLDPAGARCLLPYFSHFFLTTSEHVPIPRYFQLSRLQSAESVVDCRMALNGEWCAGTNVDLQPDSASHRSPYYQP